MKKKIWSQICSWERQDLVDLSEGFKNPLDHILKTAALVYLLSFLFFSIRLSTSWTNISLF